MRQFRFQPANLAVTVDDAVRTTAFTTAKYFFRLNLTMICD